MEEKIQQVRSVEELSLSSLCSTSSLPFLLVLTLLLVHVG